MPELRLLLFFFGLILGVSGALPASAFVFIVLHLMFRHPDRSKGKQVLLGGLLGILAFAIAAAAASFIALRGPDSPVRVGAAAVYLVLAALSVLYVRTKPARDTAVHEGSAREG